MKPNPKVQTELITVKGLITLITPSSSGVVGGLQTNDGLVLTATNKSITDSLANATGLKLGTGSTIELTKRVSQTGLGNSTFFGDNAGLNDDLSNNSNSAYGYRSLMSNTTGTNNVAKGSQSLMNSIFATDNVAIGAQSMHNTSTGGGNVAVGRSSLYANQNGTYNVAIGKNANNQRVGNHYNVAVGGIALQGNGNLNWAVAVGYSALSGNSAGSSTVGIGYEAGKDSSGAGSVFLGYRAGKASSTANSLYIANTDTATPLIHGNFGTGTLTFNVNNLNFSNIPTSAAGLAAGDVWRDGNDLKIV
jgi:hypothetical protein